MNRDIYTADNDTPRTSYDRHHPIQIHGLGMKDQSFSLTVAEATALSHSLTNTLESYVRVSINRAKLKSANT